MRPGLADELEEFVRAGVLWDPDELATITTSLEADAAGDGDSASGLLARALRSVRIRAEMGEIPPRVANDLEGIVYPRLWKIVEAIRDDAPAGELRVRIEVFNRRLSRCYAAEQWASDR